MISGNYLNQASGNGQFAFVVRHAERGELPANPEHKSIPLTEDGLLQAKHLGQNLPISKKLILTHTPTLRTRQTAEAIESGFLSLGGKVESLRELRSQLGSYVHSSEIYKLGWGKDFVKKWLRGEIDHRIIDPPLVAANKIIRPIFDSSTSNCPVLDEDSLLIHVAHDWDIYAIQSVALGFLSYTEPVGFLDGVLLQRKDNCIHVHRCGVSGLLSLNQGTEMEV